MEDKDFEQFTDDELHQTKMECQRRSNNWEWANAELEHRDRKRAVEQKRLGKLAPSTLRDWLPPEKVLAFCTDESRGCRSASSRPRSFLLFLHFAASA